MTVAGNYSLEIVDAVDGEYAMGSPFEVLVEPAQAFAPSTVATWDRQVSSWRQRNPSWDCDANDVMREDEDHGVCVKAGFFGASLTAALLPDSSSTMPKSRGKNVKQKTHSVVGSAIHRHFPEGEKSQT